MIGTYPRSEELKNIIKKHEWTLYDGGCIYSLAKSENKIHSWEEMEKMGPAYVYEVWHYYVFVPIIETCHDLLDAYKTTMGLGPSLQIDDPEDKRWLHILTNGKNNVLFTRLCFDEDNAFVTSPRTIYNPRPDMVVIDYDFLVDTFEKCFRIVTPEEFGFEGPFSKHLEEYMSSINN
jgi:hypothetical protein